MQRNEEEKRGGKNETQLRYESPFGNVLMDNTIFSAILWKTGKSFGDKMIFSTPKGKPERMNAEKPERLHFAEIEVNSAQDSVNIEVYVILKFGTSIRWFTQEFAKRLRAEAEAVCGFDIGQLGINITGMRSGKILKRELRIVC